MLRSGIFSCTCTRTSCYALLSSLVTCTHTSCYASLSSLVTCAHIDVPDVHIPNICEKWHTGNNEWNEKLTSQHTVPILRFHAYVSFTFSKWYTTSDEIISSWFQKLVSESLVYATEKTKANVSLQTPVKLHNKEQKTACTWLFQA
jgi:hypothetical protein